MYTYIHLAEHIAALIFPDTHTPEGRKAAKLTSISVCVLFWFTTVVHFPFIVYELKQYQSVLAVFGKFDRGFYLFLGAAFWLIAAINLYRSPKFMSAFCIGYILTAFACERILKLNALYLPTTNIFLCLPALIVFIQGMLAGHRSTESPE